MADTGSGRLELVADPDRPTGRTLLADGVAQSYVDLADPRHLRFDYVRMMAALIDLAAPSGRPLRALHLGGGAMTLPRYLAATRPGSTQLVVERDPAVVELVSRGLPPLAAGIQVHVADARAVAVAEPAEAYDLVLADVYQAARMPGHVATVEFAEVVARLLRPDGMYLVNLTDLPPLVFSRVQVATLRAVFADVCLVAGRRMLGGRRYGNVVLGAARQPDRLPIGQLAVRAVRDPVPGVVLHNATLTGFAAGARPATDRAAGAD